MKLEDLPILDVSCGILCYVSGADRETALDYPRLTENIVGRTKSGVYVAMRNNDGDELCEWKIAIPVSEVGGE